MDLVSIIVPVYNMEALLSKCISSLTSQTYSKIEIIIIDDGSTDGSGELCDYLGKLDQRVRVIHQQNKGVAHVRKRGIEISKGKFITFVDSDDWLDKQYIEIAVDSFRNRNVDIVCEGMVLEYSNGTRNRYALMGSDYLFSRKEAVEELFRLAFFSWGVCGKVYRKRLFLDYDIDESITMGEDLESNWNLFNRARNVFYTCRCDYHYYQYFNSATHNQDFALDNSFDVFERILNSEYKLPHYGREHLLRFETRLLLKKIRAMYLEDPYKHEKKIDGCCDKFVGLIKIYRDLLTNQNELIELINRGKTDRDRIFRKEYKNLKDLADKAVDYEHVFIYGIGVAAESIYRLVNDSIKEKVVFVISDSHLTEKKYLGREVLGISEIKPEDGNIFIMSIRDAIRQEVIEGLKRQGHMNIAECSLTNYFYRRID